MGGRHGTGYIILNPRIPKKRRSLSLSLSLYHEIVGRCFESSSFDGTLCAARLLISVPTAYLKFARKGSKPNIIAAFALFIELRTHATYLRNQMPQVEHI